LILLAVALFVLSVRQFRRARTPIRSRKVVTAVITTGPYRFSRNPIYVSFTLLQVGLAMWTNSAWVAGTLIPTLVLISYGVIAREERYMAQKFGDEYLQYKRACDGGSRWPAGAAMLDYQTLRENRHRLECRRLILTHMSADMLSRRDEAEIECADDGQVIVL